MPFVQIYRITLTLIDYVIKSWQFVDLIIQKLLNFLKKVFTVGANNA